MVEYEDWGSFRIAQLEQQDLERYQRELDLQRRIVRMRRPIQRSEMRVPDYYRRFCDWRKDMISVGYLDDESCYIDDFIGNLQWYIRLRVIDRRTRISRLVDAYYEAHFDETTILLERLVKDLKRSNEINEMDGRFLTKIEEDGIFDSVDEVSIENNQQVEPYVENLKANIAEPYAHKLFDDMPRSLSIELKEEDGDSDGAGACDEQHPNKEIQSNDYAIKSVEDGNQFMNKLLPNSFVKYEETELNEGNDCVVLGKLAAQIDADKVFVEMTEPVIEEDFLGIGVTKATHYRLNGRSMLSPIDSNEDLYEKYASLPPFLYIIEPSIGDNASNWVSGLLANISKGTAQYLGCEDGVLRDNVTKFPPLSKLEFNPQGFDPGTFFKQEEYESQLHCISSEPLLIYSQEYGEFYAHKHLVIEYCFCLFQRTWSRNSKFDWALSMWSNRELLLWDCSVPLWEYIITWTYISISTHAIANYHVGALAQLCITYNQPAPRLNNGHEISAGNAKAHFTTAAMPVGAHTDSFSKVLFKGSNSMLLRKSLYCWTLSLDKLKIKLRLVSRFGSKISVLSPLRANFSWDPGICTIFVYILVDKDVVKRVGKEIPTMVIMRSTKYEQTDRKYGLNKVCKPLWHDDEVGRGHDCILHYLPSVSTPPPFFDLSTNLNREFLKCFEYVIMSIINDFVSLHYPPSVSAAATLIHVMRDFEPCELMLYQNQLMDALKLRRVNPVTEMKSWMLYVRRISSESQQQQLPFCFHSVSFLAFQNPCVLGCLILMLWLVDYMGFSYDLGSCTILALEIACYVNSHPTSNVAYTNVVQGAKNRVVQNGATLKMWVQLRNEDFGISCWVFGARVQMMSSVKADSLLLKTMQPLLFKHSNGILVFIHHPGETTNHSNIWNRIILLYPDWEENVIEEAQARHKWGSLNQNEYSFVLDSTPLWISLFQFNVPMMLAIGLPCPAQQWDFSNGFGDAKLEILV